MKKEIQTKINNMEKLLAEQTEGIKKQQEEINRLKEELNKQDQKNKFRKDLKIDPTKSDYYEIVINDKHQDQFAQNPVHDIEFSFDKYMAVQTEKEADFMVKYLKLFTKALNIRNQIWKRDNYKPTYPAQPISTVDVNNNTLSIRDNWWNGIIPTPFFFINKEQRDEFKSFFTEEELQLLITGVEQWSQF